MRRYAMSVGADLLLKENWRRALKDIDSVEIVCNPKHDWAALAELQASGQVSIGSIHAPCWTYFSGDEGIRRRECDALVKFLKDIAPLKSPNCTLHGSYGLGEGDDRNRCLAALRHSLEEILPLAEENNMSVNIELLPRDCLGNTVEELLEIIHGLPVKNIGICMDVNHFTGHPEMVAPGIRALAPYIKTFHISDYDGVDECHWMPGMGVIDWNAVIEAVSSIEHDVLLIYELSNMWDKVLEVPRNVAPEVRIGALLRNIRLLEAGRLND